MMRATYDSWRAWIAPAALILGCELVGVAGALTTATGQSAWYQSIEKPTFNPPAWVFGPVWTTLYAMMGLAAFLVWRRHAESRGAPLALGLFAGQLFLNGIWTPVFFGLHSPLGGLIVISLLWFMLGLTVWAFLTQSKVAGLLLLPYWMWVSYASVLNACIWWLNR